MTADTKTRQKVLIFEQKYTPPRAASLQFTSGLAADMVLAIATLCTSSFKRGALGNHTPLTHSLLMALFHLFSASRHRPRIGGPNGPANGQPSEVVIKPGCGQSGACV